MKNGRSARGENSAHTLVLNCIYQALAELMRERPYREITVTDIVRKAGVSRMAYYRNFSSKDGILLEHFRLRLEAALGGEGDRELLALCGAAREEAEGIAAAGLFPEVFRIVADSLKERCTPCGEPGLTDGEAAEEAGRLLGCLWHAATAEAPPPETELIARLKRILYPEDGGHLTNPSR